ncbi:MAG: KH domain-containing protein [Christensenellales bacterium]
MEEIVEYIVKNLVQTPDEVKVSSYEDGEITVIQVLVNEDELGKVIGKNGRIAQSIRAIVRSASNGTGKKYAVKIGSETKE